MSRAQRIALLGAAAAILVAVFLLTRGDDEPSTVAETTTTTVVQPAPSTVQTTRTAPAERTTATTTKPRARPKPDPGPLLTAAAVTKLTTRVGETVRFRVRSAETDEVHVHGYDRSFAAPAGKTVPVKLKATMPGIFEIELEHAGTPIATLKVEQ
jgi:hypothetical protein